MDATITLKEVHKNDRQAPRWVYPQNRYQRGYWSTTFREFNAKPRLYMSVEDESMIENFAYRTMRPSRLYRKVLPQILRQLNLPEDTKATWSQKAGCSCGCSPGFILSIPGETPVTRDGMPWDAWATITADDTADLKVKAITPEVAYRADVIVGIATGTRL